MAQERLEGRRFMRPLDRLAAGELAEDDGRRSPPGNRTSAAASASGRSAEAARRSPRARGSRFEGTAGNRCRPWKSGARGSPGRAGRPLVRDGAPAVHPPSRSMTAAPPLRMFRVSSTRRAGGSSLSPQSVAAIGPESPIQPRRPQRARCSAVRSLRPMIQRGGRSSSSASRSGRSCKATHAPASCEDRVNGWIAKEADQLVRAPFLRSGPETSARRAARP